MDKLTNSRLAYFQAHIGQNMSSSLSPFGRWLNGTIRAVEYGSVVAEFVVREEMTNPANVMHGGVSAAILDELIGIMVICLGREYAYTSVNLTVDFLHAAWLGDRVTATAKLIRAGKNIVHCEGYIVTHDGKIVAKCATNLIQTTVRVPSMGE
jgi:acyl-coenzyme A thioesterase 13